nr:FGGY-family carbohydrate kinase [Anaerolineae bacterium]
SVASWSGLFDRESCTWDIDWLARLNLSPDRLPPLSDFDAAQHGLAREYALRWPTLAYVPWFLPVGDGAAANLGSGAVGDGQTALTLGTTGALRTTVNGRATPTVPVGLWGYRIDRARHVVGGATSEGGNVFAWARQTFVLPDADSLERALSTRRHDEHGLTALPLIAGERSPGWNASATATLHGLRASTSPLDIVQALMEGVAHRLAQIAEGIAGAGVVYAGGGALYTSPAWAQMLCDSLNRPLALLDEAEVTARGVALLLMGALDGIAAKTYSPRTRQVLTPSSEGVARMAAARARQRALYVRLYGGMT